MAVSRWTRRRRLAVALAAAAVAATALIGAAQLRADEQAARPVAAPQGPRLLAGIPQQGAFLGRADAPVTLVEYADLQCPYCAEWARQTLPVLVSAYVRPGKLRIEFRGLAFIGPDSVKGLRTAVAAGRKGRLWDIVDGLYLVQGTENSGWVSDALLQQIAGAARLDYERLVAEREQPWVARELERSSALAHAAHVEGTPTFELGRTGGSMSSVQVRSLDPAGITPAIESLLGS
jgi:protein-disulfide isomerase